MPRQTTIAELEDWELDGAVWRAGRDLGERPAVVDLCSCSGERMERVESDDPSSSRSCGRIQTTDAPAPRPARPRARAPSWAAAQAASSRARAASDGSASARRDRQPQRQRRRAAATAAARPTPAQSARAAFSAMSPAWGTASTGAPLASARTIVPWPAWQITSAQPGIVRE